MQNDANSGWLYHIGDVIFGDVLLVNAEGLSSVCSVYALSVTMLSCTTMTNFLKICSEEKISKYDCIIVDATNGITLNSGMVKELYSVL